jgi:predicted nucleotidyltransferase
VNTYQHYVQLLKSHLPDLQKDYSVASLGIFGSYVRGEQNSDSDLDVLVTFHKVPSLVKLIELEDDLETLTGLDVDVVMERGLKPEVAKNVSKEVVWL